MKYFLCGLMLISTMGLYGQLYPCSDLTRQANYKLERASNVKGYDLAGTHQVWDFREKGASSARQIGFYQTNSHKYAYLFPTAQEYWSDIESDYFLDGAGNILGKLLPMTGSSQPLFCEFISTTKACNTISSKSVQTSAVVELPAERDETVSKRVFVKGVSSLQSSASGRLLLGDQSYTVDRWDITRGYTLEFQQYSSAGWIPADRRPSLPALVNYFSPRKEYWFVEQGTNRLLVKIIDRQGQRELMYLSTDTKGDNGGRSKTQRQFSLYPSTGFGDLKLDFINFGTGEYDFIVKNAFAKELWSRRFMINGDVSHNIDLSFLPKGPYIYVLYDKNRDVILSKRFAIIKP